MTSHQSRIAELSSLIAKHTTTVDEYLREKKLPQPSFAADGPVYFQLPPGVDEARLAATEAALELQDLLKGPIEQLRPMMNATSLQAIYRWEIASKVPLNGDISYEELAKRCVGLSVVNLRRIVRFAIAWHRCFCEPRKGFVAHTAASRRLVDDELAMDELGLLFDQVYPAMARTVDALQQFRGEDELDEPNAAGYSLAHNITDSMYTHLSKHPAKAKQFGRAMMSFSKATTNTAAATANTPEKTNHHDHLADGYDWASLGSGAVVVDVGGGEGHVAIAVAQRYPNLRFIVQDLLKVVSKAGQNVPGEVSSRVSFMEHDFLQPQPVKADAYLLRHILHNWPDKYCIRILHQLIPALRPGARIVVLDEIHEDPGAAPPHQERASRALDMTMLSLYNARERDMDDWIHLFAQADPRFALRTLVKPNHAVVPKNGTLEFEWMEEGHAEP